MSLLIDETRRGSQGMPVRASTSKRISVVENYFEHFIVEKNIYINPKRPEQAARVILYYIQKERMRLAGSTMKREITWLVDYVNRKKLIADNAITKKMAVDHIHYALYKKIQNSPSHEKYHKACIDEDAVQKMVKTMEEITGLADGRASKINRTDRRVAHDRFHLALVLGLSGGGRRRSELLKAQLKHFHHDLKTIEGYPCTQWDLPVTKTTSPIDRAFCTLVDDLWNCRTILENYKKRYGLTEDEHYLFFNKARGKYSHENYNSINRRFKEIVKSLFNTKGYPSLKCLRISYVNHSHCKQISSKRIIQQTKHSSTAGLHPYRRQILSGLSHEIYARAEYAHSDRRGNVLKLHRNPRNLPTFPA